MTVGALRIPMVVGLLIATAQGAAADFCGDLRVVIDSAAEGFESVRGELVSRHVDPLSDSRIVWRCSRALVGADTCEVEWLRQTFSYHTYWTKQGSEANTEAFDALTELLNGCGLRLRGTSKSGRSLWFVIDGEVDLDLVLARNDRRVRLTVSTSGFPHP